MFQNFHVGPMKFNMQVPQRTMFLSRRLLLSLLIHNDHNCLKHATKIMLCIQVFEHQFRFWCLPKCVPIEKVNGSVLQLILFCQWHFMGPGSLNPILILNGLTLRLVSLAIVGCFEKINVLLWWEAGPADGNTLVRGTQTSQMANVKLTWWLHVTLAVEVFAWHKQHCCSILLSGAFWICSSSGCVLAWRRYSGDVTERKGLPCSELMLNSSQVENTHFFLDRWAGKKSVENHVALPEIWGHQCAVPRFLHPCRVVQGCGDGNIRT